MANELTEEAKKRLEKIAKDIEFEKNNSVQSENAGECRLCKDLKQVFMYGNYIPCPICSER